MCWIPYRVRYLSLFFAIAFQVQYKKAGLLYQLIEQAPFLFIPPDPGADIASECQQHADMC